MGFTDKYKVGIPKWLVYYHKGEIKVRKGYLGVKNNFYPVDSDTWMTTCPREYMKVTTKGRVLVREEKDIPQAKEMIKQYFIGKISEIENIAVSQLTNIQKMLKEDDNE